ncbi:MAG: choice-of-anchor tandem repeat GloVer-containing protein [Candidatus Sulfotelmatobacter sp.]
MSRRTFSLVRYLTTTFAAAVVLIAAAPAYGQTFTTLVDFNGSNSRNPQAALIQGTDGNFYGTAPQGGPDTFGTIFQLTPAGALTTLYSFCLLAKCADGEMPSGGLVQGTDGNFYGTTQSGGANDYGTIFKITSTGTLTTLHSFTNADGAYPQAALVQAPDGTFYGTTREGGLVGSYGSVFEITPAGVFKALHSFTGTDGAYPVSGLVRAADGNLYGTAQIGGGGAYCGANTGCGTVFKITPTGTLTTLHSFDGADGTNPLSTLVETSGGFYGTTYQGGDLTCDGTYGCGTVFKITPSGALTTLHRFHAADGGFPFSGVTYASDGNFYGTTEYGVAGPYGTIFEITPPGVLTTLESFDNTDGTHPLGGLLQASDGTFYGTTVLGGSSNDGVIFSFSLAPAR